ncbi:MAG: hypothetical protein CVU71_18080 [Deltaproteobacteria bacterium HGW-Deltaproteobacteria-6]|nr:MAG: hypothetical protein CVU71_18080 [Deltaproteobacteria bacterium HGW-Deltaproteobacteria-6]
MDQKQIAKQWIEFNKTAFDNTFNAMTVLQDQTERLVSRFLEKAIYFPEEGKKAIHDWINAYKKGREDFKATADNNYKKVTDYFADFQKETAAKSGEKK